MKIALAHDWLVGMRGGERVLDRLARLYGPTDLYVMVSNGRPHSPAIDACRVHVSRLQAIPGAAGPLRRSLLLLYPWAVESLRVDPRVDLLISTSSSLIKSIRPPKSLVRREPVPHLCYCHSPARYLWSSVSRDYGVGSGGIWRRAGLRLFGPRLRAYDRRSAARVTRFVANSHHTARAIARCFDRDSTVIHPPVDTDYFTPDPTIPREDFYLVASALEPYKRIDLAVDAARRGDFRLVVAGTGAQERYLRSIAGATTEFRGFVSRDELRDLFRRARAMLFPGVEDFGMTPVEAMACGAPVIARAEGGALDWMAPGATAPIAAPTVASILDAIREFERLEPFDPAACRRQAERFAAPLFNERIDAEIRALTA
ncbi:MAG: glycosyltransferase [Phycisphaerales bacterium]